MENASGHLVLISTASAILEDLMTAVRSQSSIMSKKEKEIATEKETLVIIAKHNLYSLI